jgi:hypothetical protein
MEETKKRCYTGMKIKNWKNVPLPKRCEGLRKTKSGLIIPYVILIDSAGQEHFKINDSEKVQFCRRYRVCAICGQYLLGEYWLIGGPKAAFHKHGAYVDTPMHYECGNYAAQVCPFIAARSYNTMMHDLKQIKSKVAPDDKRLVLIDPTMDAYRPDLFVLLKCNDFDITFASEHQIYILPKRPYEAFEFWKNGEKLPNEQGMDIVKGLNLNPEEMINDNTERR